MTSKIKVDNINKVSDDSNIINKCGTTITLGASGDTINLASGASQTGFGRTGTVDWITTPKVTGDSPVTGVTGKGYFLNTTAGTITLNLPAGSAGDIVSMADYADTWDTYNVTVAPNGTDKIGGSNANATLSTGGQSVTFVYVDSTQGWVNTMDSTSNVRGSTYMTASVSGACNTLATAPDCANTKIATFVNPGTFTVCTAGNPSSNNVVSYMVVGGGGGGGKTVAPAGAGGGGGGGAGGFREYKSPVTPYTASPLDGNPGGTAITVSAIGYPIAVGGGATPVATTPIANGTPSTFDSITATGGGTGGIINPGGGNIDAEDGGSGGGGPASSPSGGDGGYGTGNSPPTTPAQGTDGGEGNNGGYGAGGGGGATVAGTNAPKPGTQGTAGNGGTGATTSISATPTAYAGGGGGGTYGPGSAAGGSAGAGGGGIGAGETCAATAGGINTGGGGGGGSSAPILAEAGGGSGIVIIRYKFQ